MSTINFEILSLYTSYINCRINQALPGSSDNYTAYLYVTPATTGTPTPAVYTMTIKQVSGYPFNLFYNQFYQAYTPAVGDVVNLSLVDNSDVDTVEYAPANYPFAPNQASPPTLPTGQIFNGLYFTLVSATAYSTAPSAGFTINVRNLDTAGVNPGTPGTGGSVTDQFSIKLYRNNASVVTRIGQIPGLLVGVDTFVPYSLFSPPPTTLTVGSYLNVRMYDSTVWDGGAPSVDIYDYRFANGYTTNANPNDVGVLMSKAPDPVICFKDGSKILCLVNGAEEYIAVEQLKKGTLIKTLRDGFLPVALIGSSTLQNSGGSERTKDRLYRLTPAVYPTLTEDLVVTGAHSILVDGFASEEQRKAAEQVEGKLFVTDGKYRLMAYLDSRAIPYEEKGDFRIWNFALGTDDRRNYGVYANGLLVESCFKYTLEKHNMKV
jgi:hypothetical protein